MVRYHAPDSVEAGRPRLRENGRNRLAWHGMAQHGGLCDRDVCCGTLFEVAAVGLGHVARRGERAVDGRLGQGRFHTLSSRIILLVPGVHSCRRVVFSGSSQPGLPGWEARKDGASEQYVGSVFGGVKNSTVLMSAYKHSPFRFVHLVCTVQRRCRRFPVNIVPRLPIPFHH